MSTRSPVANSRGTYGSISGRASGGSSSRSAWIRSPSSSRAKSMSVPRANSTVISECASLDSDVILRTPFTCWAAPSSGAVRNASTTSGDAPGQLVVMVSCGYSMSGSSSTGMSTNEATPIAAMAM